MNVDASQGENAALAGLRVVELAHERVEFAAKMLADMGAEVIVVEPPSGAASRRVPPFLDDEPGPERSLHWWHYNTSKKSVTLDLDDAADRQLLTKLIRTADVLIQGEDPGRLAALGLDYDALRARHGELVMVSVTPFGQSGPRRVEQATDLTILAAGGPVWSCGYDDHSMPPIRGWGNQGYQIGGLYAVIGTLVALVHRQHSGSGQHIDVSLHAASNVTTEQATYMWLLVGKTVSRQTGRHAEVQPTMPTQVQCADGQFVNTGVPPRVQREFAAVHGWLAELELLDEFPEAVFLEMGMQRDRIDLSKLAEDPEIQAIFGAGREAMTLIASRLPAYEFFVAAHTRGLPVGIIYSPEEVLGDPHFQARRFPTRVPHPELARSVVYPGAPYRFSATPWRIGSRAPLLGEHAALLDQLDAEAED